ncbi:GNAT family N-acetyltransferase [Antarctobacter heliothermus]|uniref:Putative acetyltransferase n=1 Tax=Antarctobacter heliothermus TaxID=74033 RepID=A0A239I717_9RHOB|nr:GNAT family N-acetyltransferase [Antarctobacter heliothermus]SNS89172.1 putative acetyltransferase [Antarctobacter heliothermus]
MMRKYKTDDIDALITIWDTAEPLAHPFLSDEIRRQVRKDMRNIYLPNADTWVLEHDGVPVGFIAMIGTEIGGLFLAPTHQGKGMGRHMVDHIVAIKGPLTVEVFKDNKIGLPFYERYGFVKTGEGAFDASGDKTFKMAMLLRNSHSEALLISASDLSPVSRPRAPQAGAR